MLPILPVTFALLRKSSNKLAGARKLPISPVTCVLRGLGSG